MIIDNKYIYNFYKHLKNDIKCYKCTYYKKSKCPSYIKLNKDKNIIEYQDNHNHLISDKESPKVREKSTAKKEITSRKNPFQIKGKDIYKNCIKDSVLIVPEYKTLKSVIYRKKIKIYVRY